VSSSRATIRTQLAALLRANVSAAQAVYAYPPGDIAGASPVLVVSSRGSRRSDMTFQGQQHEARLAIDVYVAIPTSAGAYTDADAADVLDTIEAQIADVIRDTSVLDPTWQAIDEDGDSTIEIGVWDGAPYYRERIPLTITVYG
jgi:hypothetical protein